jgi:trk system potassium uptake protein
VIRAGHRYVLGQFLLVLAATMLVPIGWGLARGSGGVGPLFVACAITGAAGLALVVSFTRPPTDFTARGAAARRRDVGGRRAFGALPFYFSPWFPSFTDAFFEVGLRLHDHGATVLDRCRGAARAAAVLACFSHWLGGMGIVLLGVAVLPLVGHGGMQLYRAEFSGARSERLKPG